MFRLAACSLWGYLLFVPLSQEGCVRCPSLDASLVGILGPPFAQRMGPPALPLGLQGWCAWPGVRTPLPFPTPAGCPGPQSLSSYRPEKCGFLRLPPSRSLLCLLF